MTNVIHPATEEFSQQLIDVDPILLFFHYSHLPKGLQSTSRPFCELAAHIVTTLPRNAERTVALRKLLEAKDAAVRANVSDRRLNPHPQGEPPMTEVTDADRQAAHDILTRFEPSLSEVAEIAARHREAAEAPLRAEVERLREALHEGKRAIGDHSAPDDCYATGPLTGDDYRDLVECPACSFIAVYEALKGPDHD